ncbi:MAG TPA: hypothetical protein VJS68_02335, partial [Thermoplasmata archaeon]|nr:hypothetical protein [Thermoplasmata archaeon]
RGRRLDDPESTPAPESVLLNGREKELFYARLTELVAKTDYPRHKRRGFLLLARRVLGRATPSEAEFRMLLGFLKSVQRKVTSQHGRSR